MVGVIEYWNVNITPSGGGVVTIIKACNEPVIEFGYIHITYLDSGGVRTEGFNLSELSGYSVLPVISEK